MATRLPYLVGEGDIYSRIMGQQAAPSSTANYYQDFTGGYDPSLYQRRRNQAAANAAAGAGSGLLDTGGGGGDTDASGGVSGNPADAIALGQALSAYGGLLGGFAPGGFLAGLAGKGLTSSGITALGELEAKAAQMANDQAAMDALAGLSNAAVGEGEAQAIADALANESGLAVAADAQAVANAALDAQAAADMQAALDAVAAAEAQAAADAQAADAAAADVAAMGDVGMGSGVDSAGGYAAADGVGSSGFDGTGSFGSSDGGGGGGGGGGKIICTKLHDLGLMPRDIYEADQAFGALLVSQSPQTYAGYVVWAKHIVKWMDRKDLFGAFVRHAAHAIATPWSIAMAQEMGLPVKSSWFGRALLKNGLRVCQFIGKMNQVRGVQNV